jgi:hypothetical protein
MDTPQYDMRPWPWLPMLPSHHCESCGALMRLSLNGMVPIRHPNCVNQPPGALVALGHDDAERIALDANAKYETSRTGATDV